ncbi:MAG: sensor histidine kinase [Pseudomonadota bacterium]
MKENAYVRQMARLATAEGNDAQAVSLLERQLAAAETHADRRLQIGLATAMAEFDSEGADLKLSLQEARTDAAEAKAEAAEANASRGRLVVAAAVIGLILSLLITVVLFRNLRLGRRVNAQLAQNLEQRKVFERDIQHRARNNLQSILSLINMHRRSYGPENKDQTDLALDLSSRVQAMAVLEDRLYGPGGKLADSIDMEGYLGEIITTVAETAGAEDRLAEISVDPATLEPEIAAPLGLIVSELLLNAFKYSGNAAIRVAFSIAGAGDQIRMMIADDGPGMDAIGATPAPKRPRNRSGLGLQIVQDLTRQIGGKIVLDKDVKGTVWRFTGPTRLGL